MVEISGPIEITICEFLLLLFVRPLRCSTHDLKRDSRLESITCFQFSVMHPLHNISFSIVVMYSTVLNCTVQ